MSAKDSIAIQTYELSEEEFNDFLALYPIPHAYHVILPKSNQTIFDAPPGYVRLYTYSFSLANLRLPLTEFFCEVLEYFQPTVELFRGFFNLRRGGKWLTFAKRPEKHIPHLFPKVITQMAFRNFVYAEDEEDLSFLPKEPSPGFSTGSPFMPSPKPELFVVHLGSVAARIKDRKCKTRGGSSRPPIKRKLAFGSSNSRATRAKTSTSKDDVPFLTVSDDDEGLSDVPELKDATACQAAISIFLLLLLQPRKTI
ncbi:hypothetical protein Tco_0649132 [Tanacetum coccineum]